MPDPVGQDFDLDAAISTALSEPETAPETPESASAPADSPTTDAPDPAAPDASPDGESPPAALAPVTPFDPSKHIPLDSGDPFTFRVDGRQVAPDGARVVGDHIVFPKTTWQQMHTLLADRSVIKERETGYRQRIQALEAGQGAWQQEKSALLAQVDRVFSDPAAAQQFLENWQVHGPRLRAEMEAKAARAQLDAVRQRDAEAEAERQDAALVPQLFDGLGATLEAWLQDEGIDWQNDPDKHWGTFLREVWDDHGKDGLFTRDPLTGRYELNEDKVARLFQREATRYKARQRSASVTSAQVEKKVQQNAAAIAPAKPKPPVPGKPVARAPDGTFTKQPKAQVPTADEWEEEFSRAKFLE